MLCSRLLHWSEQIKTSRLQQSTQHLFNQIGSEYHEIGGLKGLLGLSGLPRLVSGPVFLPRIEGVSFRMVYVLLSLSREIFLVLNTVPLWFQHQKLQQKPIVFVKINFHIIFHQLRKRGLPRPQYDQLWSEANHAILVVLEKHCSDSSQRIQPTGAFLQNATSSQKQSA